MAIVGLGLMGGSLALALRSRTPSIRILGIDVDPVVGTRALGDGLVDRFELPGDGMDREVELVVLAGPPRAALGFIAEEGATLSADTLLTDLTGLNAPILRTSEHVGLSDRTVSAHPLCGSQESGLAAARGDLYRDAPIWLSATSAPPEIRRRIQKFWEGTGGDCEWIEAQEHDRRMAWVSHLPQLVANALAGALDSAGFRPEDLGPGGRDMTRLAASSPPLWSELLDHSAPITGTGLTSVSRALSVVADLLARRDLDRIEEFMELTRRWSLGQDSLAERAEEKEGS